jgi:hypothetical protein
MRLQGVVTVLGMCLALALLVSPGWAEDDMSGYHPLKPDDVTPGASVRYPFVCANGACTLISEVCHDKAKGTVRPKAGKASAMGEAPMPANPSVMVWKPMGPDQVNMYGRQFEIPACQ